MPTCPTAPSLGHEAGGPAAFAWARPVLRETPATRLAERTASATSWPLRVVARAHRMRPLADRWWSRRMWLRAAIVHAAIAGLVMMSPAALGQGADGALLRQAAQVALMHAMATIACATFMKMGASGAAHVPVFFMVGTLLYSGPIYISCAQGSGLDPIRIVGAVCLAGGWLRLLLAASAVDRAPV